MSPGLRLWCRPEGKQSRLLQASSCPALGRWTQHLFSGQVTAEETQQVSHNGASSNSPVCSLCTSPHEQSIPVPLLCKSHTCMMSCKCHTEPYLGKEPGQLATIQGALCDQHNQIRPDALSLEFPAIFLRDL